MKRFYDFIKKYHNHRFKGLQKFTIDDYEVRFFNCGFQISNKNLTFDLALSKSFNNNFLKLSTYNSHKKNRYQQYMFRINDIETMEFEEYVLSNERFWNDFDLEDFVTKIELLDEIISKHQE